MAVTYEQGLAFVRGFAAAIAENKEYLTQLDSAIGDADHGTNMDRGMQAALAKLGVPRAGRPGRSSSRRPR